MKHDLDINMSFSGSILSDDKCSLVAYLALPDYRYKLEYQINRSKELYNEDEFYLTKMADEISKEEYICRVFSGVIDKLKEIPYEDLYDTLSNCNISVTIKSNN